MTTRPTLLLARGVVPRASSFPPDAPVGDVPAGLLVRGGRVLEVARGRGALDRLVRRHDPRRRDLGDVVLLPGLVNAHAHLELGPLAGHLPGDAGFPAWVGALLRARADLTPGDHERGAASGLARALATGTTTLGDIDSTGAVLAAVGRAPRRPRLRVYREVLDAWDPARTAAALARLEPALREGARLVEGYAPHAPFTTSRALLAGVAARRRRRPRPLAVHWAESPDELAWLEDGGGGFAGALGASPGVHGLDLLEEAGLLGPATALVHGNLPRPGERARIAAAGASLVHCPGTHAFFDRPSFDPGPWRRAGVPLALGTDSLASNADLDLRREARLLLAARPELGAGEVLALATEGGARALDLAAEVGALEPGFRADALALPVGRGATLEGLAGALFAGTAPPCVVLAGRRVPPP